MSKNTFDFNEKLAKIMANSADASEEEALWALRESGESVNGAIALLGDKKPSAKKPRDMKKTSESNEELQYIPDTRIAVGQDSRSRVAKLPPTRSKDDEYRDDPCKSNDIDNKQGLQYSPRVARRSNNCDKNNDELNEASDEIMEKKQSALDMKTESDGDEYDNKVAEQSDQDDDAEGAPNVEESIVMNNRQGVPRPREPRRNVEPGAFHADGRNARDVVLLDDEWTVDEESTAQLMEISGEMYDAAEEINREVQQKLEEMERNYAIGEVIVQDFWNSKRNRIALVVIVFVCIGIVLGAILSKSPDSPTPSPVPTSEVDDWINSCDESSRSLAKQLPCVSEDESKFYHNCGIKLVVFSLCGLH
jgi:hypothetical protein